jgi:hypothetical protein
MVRPSAFAVPRLITSSKRVGRLDWQLAGPGALEDLVGKDSSNWKTARLGASALSAGVGISERCAHGMDRNRRYDARSYVVLRS